MSARQQCIEADLARCVREERGLVVPARVVAARAATDEAVRRVEGLMAAIVYDWTNPFAVRDLLVDAGYLKLDTLHSDARCKVTNDHCAHYYAGGTCCGCKAAAPEPTTEHTTGGASDE